MSFGLPKRLFVVSMSAATSLGLLSGVMVGVQAAERATSTPTNPDSARRVASGWIPYWRLDDGVASTVSHPELFSDVSMFWFRATAGSKVVEQEPGAQPSATVLQDSIDSIQSEGIPAFLTVTDQGFNATDMARLLKDRQRRGELIANLVAKAQLFNAAGVDIDFEGMNYGPVGADRTAVKKLFPKFLDLLRGRLHNRDLRLTVTVPARTGPNDPNWNVFDYDAIARGVDRARVMAYDYHTMSGSPGPLAPLSWVNDVARYASAQFGQRLSLGIPADGYNWFVQRLSGTCPSSATSTYYGSVRALVQLAEDYDVKPRYVESAAGYTYHYRRTFTDGTNTCKVEREVWYEDSRSVEAKIRVLKRYDIKSFAVWPLGAERPRTWTVLHDYAQSINPAQARVMALGIFPVTYGDTVDVAARFTASGQPVVGEEVVVQRRVRGGEWQGVGTATTGPTGRAVYTTIPTRTYDFRMRLHDAWDWTGVTTPAMTVVVRHQVTGAFDDSTVGVGDTFTWNGSIGPAESGVSVTLQRRKDGEWFNRSTATTAGDGSYTLQGTAAAAGTFTFRVLSGKDGRHAAGISTSATLTVN